MSALTRWKGRGACSRWKKPAQICRSALVGKIELTFWNPEVMFDETQNAAEVMPEIVDIVCWRVGGDDNQRNAESILIVALGQRQNGWRLVIVPAAPIIPSNKDHSILPINFTVGTGWVVANGIDNGCHPGRSTGIVGISGVIGILPARNNPAQRSEITVADVGQHIPRVEIHIVYPLPTLTGSSRPGWLADMENGIRRRPDGTRAWRIVSPREPCRQDVRNGLMVEARINFGVLNTTRRRIRIRTNQFDYGRPRPQYIPRDRCCLVNPPLMFSEAKMPMWSLPAVGADVPPKMN